jgi:hypothetical protein
MNDREGSTADFRDRHHRPILLKKSAMVSTVEKYALEIEIFTVSGGFPTRISRSNAQNRRFQWSVCGQSRKTDFQQNRP